MRHVPPVGRRRARACVYWFHVTTSTPSQECVGNRAEGVVFALVGAVFLAGGAWELGLLRRRRPKPGQPVHSERTMVMRPDEAAAGTTIKRRKLCARCDGTGSVNAKRCRRCRGRGLRGSTRRMVTLRIPAGVRGGTIVRVRGASTASELVAAVLTCGWVRAVGLGQDPDLCLFVSCI